VTGFFGLSGTGVNRVIGYIRAHKPLLQLAIQKSDLHPDPLRYSLNTGICLLVAKTNQNPPAIRRVISPRFDARSTCCPRPPPASMLIRSEEPDYDCGWRTRGQLRLIVCGRQYLWGFLLGDAWVSHYAAQCARPDGLPDHPPFRPSHSSQETVRLLLASWFIRLVLFQPRFLYIEQKSEKKNHLWTSNISA